MKQNTLKTPSKREQCGSTVAELAAGNAAANSNSNSNSNSGSSNNKKEKAHTGKISHHNPRRVTAQKRKDKMMMKKDRSKKQNDPKVRNSTAGKGSENRE